jgi:hypothetical protein
MPVSVPVSRSVSIGFYATFLVMFLLCFVWSVKHKLNVPRDEFWDPILEAVGLSNGSDPKTKAKSDQ